MKPLLLLVFILFTITTSAQNSVSYYDSDWQPAKQKEAFYLVERFRVNDTCWEWNYYKAAGPRIRSVRYKDKGASELHGQYISYKRNGLADTVGYYYNGKKNSYWRVIATNKRTLYSIKYVDDVLIGIKDSTQLNEERKRKDDSLRKIGTDTLEISAEFAGGKDGWKNYLNRYLRYPKESIKKDAEGMAAIMFTVSKEGKVEDPGVFMSVEHQIDKEALRLIVDSPTWKPAVLYGKKVNQYLIQPVVFRLQ